MKIYAKLEGQNPTGSIKDRVALAMVDAAGLEPGARAARADVGEHRASRSRSSRSCAGYKLTCVMPANATPERRLVLKLFGAEIVDSPANEGSNGAVRLAQELAAADPRYTMLFQYENEWNPRAHYEGTGAEIVRDLPRVDALVAGLGTGGTLMGTGARLREAFPDVVVAAAEPLPGDPVMGLRSLEDGYVAADPRRLEARPEDPRLERRVGRRGACAARPRGDLRGRLGRRGRSTSRASIAGELPGGLGRRRGARRRRLEVPFRRLLERRRRRGVDGEHALVVVPAAIREELHAHAAEEAPNECCGVLVFRDGVAERYVRGRNRLASPYRYELEIDPEVWFLEDEGYELAVFHSHPETEPRPVPHRPRALGPLGRQAVPDLRPRVRQLRAWRSRATTPRSSSSRRRSGAPAGPGKPRCGLLPRRCPAPFPEASAVCAAGT